MMKSYFSSQPGTPWRRLALAALLSGSSLAAYATGGAPTKHARPTAANDAAVTSIYTYGRLATPRALPHAVQAVITNVGTDFLLNVPVTLTVSGSNTYTNTQTVSVLAAGASTTVTFAPYPTSFSTGSNTVTVTVPNDDVNSNNSASQVQRMTSGRVSYIDTTAALNTAGASVGSAGGVLAVKYTLLTSTTYLNAAVATFAAGSAGTYQVLVYDATGAGGAPGNVLYTSGVRSRTAAAGSVTIPLPTVQVSSSFFIALKELDNPLGVATQNESPLRPGVFYTQASGGSWTAVTAQTRRALDVVVGPVPTCAVPTAITATSNSATSASVSFTGPSNGTQYTVVYVPAGTAPTSSSPSVSGTSSPITITGLTANTRYDVYVTTTCGTSGTSAQGGPAQVTTACRTYTYPYTENFDGVTAPTLPCGITVLNANNDSQTWTNNSGTANSTPNAMRYMYNTSNAANDWFFTPGLPMVVGKSYQLQFKYRGYTSGAEGMEVKVGNDATAAGQTTTLFTNTNITGATYVTTTTGTGTGQVALFTPTASGTYYFGFHAISGANQWYLYVDDLVVSEITTPNCPAPTSVTVANPTVSSATVTFTTSPSSASYTLIYGPAGFTPGTSAGTSVPVSGSPYTLNSLNPNTSYDVYVQANCTAGGTSLLSAPATFATACAAVSNFPYTENFDGVTAPNLPCGITVLDANSDGTKWTNNSGTANSTPNAMRYMYSFSNPADDWFFTQALNLQGGVTYQLQFKYRGYTSGVEGMEVKIGTGATVAGQTTTLFSNTNITGATYITTAAGTGAGQVAPFTPTASGTYYIGFHAISATNQWYLYVDDVQVTATGSVPCPSPSNVQIGSITANSASVSFVGPSNGASYTVTYGPRGFNPATGGQTATGSTSPITITGLNSSTIYDVYVRATCSGTAGSSLQSAAATFTSACAPATMPYSEGFDQVTAPALACNITVLDANSDGSTWGNVAEFPNSSPNAMRYMFNNTNNADDWFFTAGLPLTAGTTYQLQFKYRVRTYPEKLEVKVGTAATAAGQTRVVFTNNNITNQNYATTTAGTGAGQVAPFTPTTTGIYYFGFHAMSDANSYYIYVDDVNVAQALGTRSSAGPGFSATASPVPFGDRLNVDLSTLQAGAVQLTLHDAVGRVVSESTTSVAAGASSLAVPGVSALPAGMYLLTVRQGSNTQVIRVAHE